MHIKLHALPYNTHSYSHSHPMGGEALAALLWKYLYAFLSYLPPDISIGGYADYRLQQPTILDCPPHPILHRANTHHAATSRSLRVLLPLWSHTSDQFINVWLFGLSLSVFFLLRLSSFSLCACVCLCVCTPSELTPPFVCGHVRYFLLQCRAHLSFCVCVCVAIYTVHMYICK